jgi:putative DNA primase/helicase
MSALKAVDIHERIGRGWPAVLSQLGVAESFLRLKKSGPCPACGGSDRYTFDNRKGRGDFICRGCGAGDGFELLKRVYGWPFSEARKRVMAVAGLGALSGMPAATSRDVKRAAISPDPIPSHPPGRVRALVTSSCGLADCPDAVAYLESRGLWPLPPGCSLKAHPSLDYWHEGQRVGRFAGLVAEVRDITGELVTAHITYLSNGRKLADREPRKLLSPLTGREGCAVRLMPAAATLGIAEGIETALSAAALEGVPVWAALNTSLLARFEPPQGTERLVIFADRDEAGLLAACRLMERLQGRVRLEVRAPAPPHNDFNDVLMSRIRGEGNDHE